MPITSGGEAAQLGSGEAEMLRSKQPEVAVTNGRDALRRVRCAITMPSTTKPKVIPTSHHSSLLHVARLLFSFSKDDGEIRRCARFCIGTDVAIVTFRRNML